MKEPRWGLSGQLVATAASARLDVKFDILVYTWPIVLLHERTTGFVNGKMVPQIVVM